MNGKAFASGIEQALRGVGFRQQGGCLSREQSGVSVLINCQKGFGNQWFVNVGFWLSSLGKIEPDRVEQSHLYFRLERIATQWRQIIVGAGALDDGDQPEAYRQLLTLIVGPINDLLAVLGTEDGLRSAIRDSKVSDGLIRKEAREFLS